MATTSVNEKPSTTATDAYYQGFSLQVGAEDWRHPNTRHLRIRRELVRLLGGAKGLHILDVGCGAGVLTSGLCQYGEVTGTDVSAPAIRLATELEPRASFLAGRFQELDLKLEFDVITLFDVLEHVPIHERSELFALLDARLSSHGWLILTTPHPAYTRWLRQHKPELLQIVDEPVEPREVLALATDHALSLVDYRTYDVDRVGTWQYQLLAFARPGDAAMRLPVRGGVARRLVGWIGNQPIPPFPQTQRYAHALRLMREGRSEAARWLLGYRDSLPIQTDR